MSAVFLIAKSFWYNGATPWGSEWFECMYMSWHNWSQLSKKDSIHRNRNEIFNHKKFATLK
jgi:hypothetical protein